jgi:heme/copper-type cytochrome/quinol oxidase subunit 4
MISWRIPDSSGASASRYNAVDQHDGTDAEVGTSSGVSVYTIGFLLAVTTASFWVADTSLLWAPGIPLGLVGLAIAQMGFHLVFFLHITTGPAMPTTCWRWRLACSRTAGHRRVALDHGEPE